MAEIRSNDSLAPPCTDLPDGGSYGGCDLIPGLRETSLGYLVGCPPAPPADDVEMFEPMLCVPESKLITTGLQDVDSGDVVIFVNAGGGELDAHCASVKIDGDSHFEGGDTIRTNVSIADTGNCSPTLYQSARFGNVSYTFCGLSSGNYFVDLHFAEIIYTNGPKGMRVFDVYMQGLKVLSEVDIYAVVGANKSLVVRDVGVYVEENGVICIKFEGVHGSPSISGICVRRAKQMMGSTPGSTLAKAGNHLCSKCASEMEHSPTQQKRGLNPRTITRYEKKIQELESLCKHKTDECYEAWMSLTDANAQLEKLKMELDTKLFRADSLDETVRTQRERLESVLAKYGEDKKLWVGALRELQAKVQLMRREQAQLSHDAHECASSVPDLNKMIVGVEALVRQCEDLKFKYSEELAKRKRLYNQVQEAKGNIRVFCRCRPLSKEEASLGYATVVDFESARDGDLGLINGGGSSRKTFKFDRVFTPKDDQAGVFADASPLVVSVLDGYNVCIFAYGQTGTGKTFTMEGTEQNRGVNYRTLEELFKIAREKAEAFSYSITVSVLEVYNEQIRDLLATSPASKNLKVRQASEGAHHVPGIVEARVENIREVWDVLQAGSNARVVGSNNVNEHSSRSHCMLCIMVRAKNLVSGECTKSKLWLVDLAGSERLAKTEAQGERLKEAQNINKSLSALGDVISALANKSSHVPYRNSKLTHLLQDSLGGDSKVLMFVQIGPSENDYSETLSSLNFATRVRGVELGPAKRQVDTGEVQKAKQMLDKTRQECRSKDESLRKMEESCQTLEGKLRSRDQLCRSLQEKVKELEAKAELESLSERQQHLQVSEALKAKEEACSILQQRIKELECRLKEQQQSALYRTRELENRLGEKESRESFLELKIKDLQEKLDRESRRLDHQHQHQQHQQHHHHHHHQMPAGTGEGEEEGTPSVDYDVSARILRTSNAVNQAAAVQQESILLKGVDSLHQIKRRRERETENDGFKERKSAAIRQTTTVDSSKAYGRVTRAAAAATTSTSRPAGAPQRLLVRGRERERTTKVWSR